MTKRRADYLPPTLAPRGLGRGEAAAYCGVSVTLFDRMVEDGLMPKAKRIAGRLIWDRLAIDAAFSELPSSDGAQTAQIKSDSWADYR